MRPFFLPYGKKNKPPVVNLPFYWLIRFYKLAISPFLGNNCRFHPTCSDYAGQCFCVYILPIAVAKTAWRILRCNPWNRGGYDPVVKFGKEEGSAVHG